MNMIRHPQTVLTGDIGLIGEPINNEFVFKIVCEQRLKDMPDRNPVAIYGLLKFDKSNDIMR
jgi:hypothetical protein